MLFFLLVLAAGAVAAGIATSRKGVPAEVSAAMADKMAKYTDAGPNGERVFKPDVALGIVRTLAGQLYSYVDPSDKTRISIRPDPTGAPPSSDLSALGWARAQNGSMTVMAPVYMAESTSADRFLRVVAPGQESFDGGQLYAVLAYPQVLTQNQNPPGGPSPASSLPAPVVMPTPLSAAHDELPPTLQAIYQDALTHATDPTVLAHVADELDAGGMHAAAELIRKRMASLTAVSASPASAPPAPVPSAVPTSAPSPSPQHRSHPRWHRGQPSSAQPPAVPGAHASTAPGTAVVPTGDPANTPPVIIPASAPMPTPSGVLAQTPAGTAAVIPAADGGSATVVLNPVQKAAVAMNLALGQHGYKAVDMPVYRAFQSAARLTPDGYPGSGTMNALQSVLGGLGIAMAPVGIYPWNGRDGYDGVNAPTPEQWYGQPRPGRTPASQPQASRTSAPAPSSLLAKSAMAMNLALASHGYKAADQRFYRAFQQAAGLSPDGYPGAGTMSSLSQVLSSAGIPMAQVKVYPWSSRGGYDGVNAPSSSEWYGGGGAPAPARAPQGSPAAAAASARAPAVQAGPSGIPDASDVLSHLNLAAVPASYHPGANPNAAMNAAKSLKPSKPAVPAAASARVPAQTPTAAAALAMNHALAAHGYKKADMGLYRAFQHAVGTSADGYPGAGTMAKLQSTLQGLGVAMAPVTVYPWRSAGAYDGKNAPSAAAWNS